MSLRIAVIADLHVINPWMDLGHVALIAEQASELAPDIVLLAGDFAPSAGMRKWARRVGGGEVPHSAWARILSRIRAPLGVHAVLGNHDWWEDDAVQYAHSGPTPVGRALTEAGISLLENDAVRLEQAGQPFWLLGLGDQWAFYIDHAGNRRPRRFGFFGVDDLGATLAKVTDDAPAILLAHEPDIFPEVPDRVALTISGHTHGGQVQVLGWAPIVPSRFGPRYVYGHVREAFAGTGRPRDLVVSAGLGLSGVPFRFGRPPEIVLIELGGAAPAGRDA